jgi:NDP-sugar pyrophosphorylase family protein
MTKICSEVMPADAVRQAMRDSELLRGVLTARHTTPQSRGLRQLTPDEISSLKDMRNAAEDWARVWVPKDFNPHKIVGCYFSGDIALGSFKEKVVLEPGVSIGSGVYNSDLCNVSVGDNALVSNNHMIANYHIGSHAIVQGCGSVCCTGETTFGNGLKASLGLETPNRETAFFAELTVEAAARIAAFRKDMTKVQAYEQAVGEYLQQARSSVGVIEAHAMVKNTPKVLNTYVGPYAEIDAAAWIENATLLSSREEAVRVASGAVVRDSIVQWGARIETHAIVERSVCCEHSYVDSHGKLRHSLLGPNSGLSSGECAFSLVGPFVGFHHQSLLIAAYWPQGKGNIGYGANIGSNHTSKAADQEIWPGEGMFFGLGVSIKYPADYSKSPYSIIATGVSTLPQRVEMPFCLINGRAESIDGISPAYNEILPGWVLSDNIYAVRRNERKYAIRDKSSRGCTGFEVFRPDIVDLMVKARHALRSLDGAITPARAARQRSGTAVDVASRPVYTDKDLPCIGKNFMKETARLEGIESYTNYIRMYALKGLYFGARFCLQHDMDARRVLEPGFIDDPRYAHELALLLAEFPGKGVPELLNELVAAHKKMCADTQLSKEKDNFRGLRIIPDFAEIHDPAAEDPFIRATVQETEDLQSDIDELLKKLQ